MLLATRLLAVLAVANLLVSLGNTALTWGRILAQTGGGLATGAFVFTVAASLAASFRAAFWVVLCLETNRGPGAFNLRKAAWLAASSTVIVILAGLSYLLIALPPAPAGTPGMAAIGRQFLYSLPALLLCGFLVLLARSWPSLRAPLLRPAAALVLAAMALETIVSARGTLSLLANEWHRSISTDLAVRPLLTAWSFFITPAVPLLESAAVCGLLAVLFLRKASPAPAAGGR
jgi:hypothetical protein